MASSRSAIHSSCWAKKTRPWAPSRRRRWGEARSTSTSTSRRWTPRSRRRWPRARKRSCRSPTCSGAIGSAPSRTRTVRSGRWQRTRRTWRRARCRSGRRPSTPRAPTSRVAMRDIHTSAITDAVKKLCIEANHGLEPDMLRAFDRALGTERSPAGRHVLQILKENAELAWTKKIPYCQDTGFVICFIELGQDVHVTGGGLTDAINEGVRQGYTEGYLRASIVRSPFDRVNTGDNTPAVVHVDVVPGPERKLMIMAKGGGCENRSKYKMLTPAEGVEGVKNWILECIRTAGPDACPPLIAGVGVGGTFEKAALLSKKALFRELGTPNPDAAIDALEQEVLGRANRLGIGPQGYGGDTTAFGVHILAYPCHITSLPVAVTIECHAHRHKEVTL